MWLTVRQLPIKSAWCNASLALWDFSRGNKHCIHLFTTKTIYFSGFVFEMSAFGLLFYYVIKRQLKRMFSFKSSHRWCSVKKVFNFASFTGKDHCWSLFIIKLLVFRPATLLNRGSDTGIFQ